MMLLARLQFSSGLLSFCGFIFHSPIRIFLTLFIVFSSVELSISPNTFSFHHDWKTPGSSVNKSLKIILDNWSSWSFKSDALGKLRNAQNHLIGGCVWSFSSGFVTNSTLLINSSVRSACFFLLLKAFVILLFVVLLWSIWTSETSIITK